MFVNEVDFVLRARVTLLPFQEQTIDGHRTVNKTFKEGHGLL